MITTVKKRRQLCGMNLVLLCRELYQRCGLRLYHNHRRLPCLFTIHYQAIFGSDVTFRSLFYLTCVLKFSSCGDGVSLSVEADETPRVSPSTEYDRHDEKQNHPVCGRIVVHRVVPCELKVHHRGKVFL